MKVCVVLLLLLFMISHVVYSQDMAYRCRDGSHAISVQDIQDAAQLSSQVYSNLGARVPHVTPATTRYICEHKAATISCPVGTTIKIHNANYGRTSRNVCPHPAIRTTRCYSSTSQFLVRRSCNNKRSCRLLASHRVFGDPCYGTFKYLEVKYSCVVSSYYVREVYTATYDGQGLRAIVAANNQKKSVIIAFRGTVGGKQLLGQLNSSLKKKAYLVPGDRRQGKVMQYPLEALKKLDVVNLMDDFKPDYKYIITGHSLGGAMATLFAIQVYHKRDKQFWSSGRQNSVITFASPRVGDATFANRHDAVISPRRKLRVVYSRDAIPQLPLLSQGFAHVSTEIFIKVTSTRKVWGWCWYGPCIKKWIPQGYRWDVCPIKHGLFTCSKQFGVNYLVTDHSMQLYVDAAKQLIKDGSWHWNRLYKLQCNNS